MKWRLLLAVFAAVALYFLLWDRDPQPGPAREASVRQVEPLVLVPRARRPAPAVAAGPAVADTAAPRAAVKAAPAGEEEREDIMPFVLQGNLAIAYGDIVLGEVEAGTPGLGWAETPGVRLWADGVVPMAIDPKLTDPRRVEDAVKFFNDRTAVRFVPYEEQEDAIYFVPVPEGCSSYLGRQGGVQPVFVGPGCSTHAIMHEMMHVLGFVHEQSRTDRDGFLEILWPNVEDKYRLQFRKVPASWMEAMGSSDFDYQSIMMYRPEAFAKRPGESTMRSKTENPIAPVKFGMSPGDLDRLQRLYGR